MSLPELSPEPRGIGAEITDLYMETDIAPPSAEHPIAPLGPLMARLPLMHQEMTGLTTGRILARLLEIGALGSEAEFGEASEEPMAGFFFACGQCAWIYVRADDPIARKRFSAAHELGHYWLHFRPLLASAAEGEPAAWRDEFADADAGGLETARQSPAEPEAETYARQEREANAFAADLLMPEAVTRGLYACWQERLYGKSSGNLLDRKQGQNLRNRLAETLLVSRQAMTIRLQSLGLAAGDVEAGED